MTRAAPSGWQIAGQALSGIGAVALFPASLTVITARTTTPAARARGLASWTTALSLGAFIAPLLSGAIVEQASFRWAFAAAGVLALLTTVAARVLAAESSAPEGRALDWPGQITIALALLCLLYGIIQGPSDGWSSAPVVLAFVAAAVLFVAFVQVESRSAAPMLRLELFRIPAFTASAVATVVGMFGFLGGTRTT
ncbi:MFS transporter [Streptomyces sp. NPDC002845]